MRLPILCAVLFLFGCGAPEVRPEPVPEPSDPLPPPEGAPATPEATEVEPEVQPEPAGDVPERAPWEQEGVRTAVSRAGTYTVHWRPVGGPVPKNEHFELDVWVFENVAGEEPRPVTGAIVAVDAWMPDHGHGMIRRPRSTDNGDGSYRVRGMLFHMGGHWEVYVDLIVNHLSERAEYTLDL